MSKNIYHKDGCLLILGCFLLVPAVISFLIAVNFGSFRYEISETTDNGVRTRYIQSGKGIEKVKKIYTGKQVTQIGRTFPVKSTIFLFICVALIVYSRLVKRKEKKIIQLWQLLEKNDTLSLNTLTQKFGYHKDFILEALHYINQKPNASFTYHAHDDLIYNDNDTVEWHLKVNCSNCGGAVNKKVFISILNSSFSCPYCSSTLTDERYNEYKRKKERAKIEENSDFINSAVNVVVENAKTERESMQTPDNDSVSWMPLNKGGSSFITRKMKVINSSRVEFKPTPASLLFGLGFVVFGFIIICSPFLSEEAGLLGILAAIIFGVFAGVLGIQILSGSLQPIVFDKSTGYFWKGWKSPKEVIYEDEIDECVSIDNILALQFIKEYCLDNPGKDRPKSYYSYELNLVLKNGSRIDVFDHGGYQRAIQDSRALAEFLDVPLWYEKF